MAMSDIAQLYFDLGTTYNNSFGPRQEAIDAFKMAIIIKPDYADAHYNLGVAYLETGDKGSALEEYKILKTLDVELANKLFNWTDKMSESVLEKRPHLIPAIIAALILLGALGRWPYGYYQLLRFVVCGVSVYVAFMAYNWHKVWVTWLFGVIAVLFNPIVLIHLAKDIWQPIDVICALLFVAIIFILQKPLEGKNE